MTIRIACNLILDCCGILILWLFLLPYFLRKDTVVLMLFPFSLILSLRRFPHGEHRGQGVLGGNKGSC